MEDGRGAEVRGADGGSRAGLFAILGSGVVSITGNRIASLAIPWFVLETTGSAARAGVAGFFEFLPIVIAGVFGGTIVDRLGYRRSSVLSDVASGLTILAIPVLYVTVGLEFWQLLALVFLGALLDAPGNTARRALIPDLAADAGWRLERATSFEDGAFRTAQMLGGPVGGILIAAIGAIGALYVDAASFAVSALVVALFVRPPPLLPSTGTPEVGTYLARMREGFAFVRRDRLVLMIMVLFMLSNMLSVGLFSILLPVYAQQVLDSAVAYGLAVGALGAGAIVGALAYGWKGTSLPRRPVLMVGLAIAGPAKYFVLAAYPPLIPIVVVMLLSGIAAGPLNPLLGAVEYERIPAHLRGRVLGLITAAVMAGMPLGALFTGLAVEGVGLRVSLLAIGIVQIGIALVPVLHPVWNELDAGRAAA